MFTIYLLDISQSIKEVGAWLILLSFILTVVGGVFFIQSSEHKKHTIEFKELRSICSYLISGAMVIALIGFCAIAFTPSKENSQYFIEQLKQEIAH